MSFLSSFDKFQHHLSRESRTRGNGPFQMLDRIKCNKDIDLISFSGGVPLPSKFPIRNLSVRFPETGYFEEEIENRYPKEVDVSFDLGKDKSENNLDFEGALQYGQCQGIPELVNFIKEHVELAHSPRYKEWEIKLTNGNTIGLDYCLRLLVNYGDSVLIEKYTYPAAITTMSPLGVKFVSIDMDEEGMLPESLQGIMENWDASNGPRPRVLYTIPTGQNPTGSTLPIGRRKRIFALAQKYDIIIIEDEPYYFLQMDSYHGNVLASEIQKQDSTQNIGVSSFVNKLVPSFLKLDTEGRVLRLDSFSKLIAPGSRLGWITGNPLFIDRITRAAEVSTESPSGISQVALYAILNHWKQEGFFLWLQELQRTYTTRRNALLQYADKYLPNSICSYQIPNAGLFLWVELNKDRYLFSSQQKSVPEIELEIFQALLQKGVKPVCGQLFMAYPENNDRIFFRFAYSIAPIDKFEVGLQRFASTLKDFFILEKEELQAMI
ncbi:aromatic aminotransferase [Schizosaccharomyces cryophilus OY26]|uniref:Aromatic aminotransferase n=1 Tax=Schizosaccharomyces cryophilus (strain OY26 / ATCC MYA-4695 / CBS 11777 / NBRC 106824 / NRRL Y48691) TaxID=653667 RepID=S9X5A9_SCHCR|nr:aromatic aminotransferase [Schizosaccharomyces cryophilus OY26]EPY52287.1 aromatic aminotransferase [Schizosaccharomyces cryophilus OY26]